MTTDYHNLFCLLHGESTVFQVKAPIDSSILDVKELTQGKNKGLLSVDATDIELWKVKWSK
jgi:hypothetical protein